VVVWAARASFTSISSVTSLTSISSVTSLTSLTSLTLFTSVTLLPDSRPRSRRLPPAGARGEGGAVRTIKGGGGKENERAGARGQEQRTI
jgi:hypothetical protein